MYRYVHIYINIGPHGGQKMLGDHLELYLQVVVSIPADGENRTQVLSKSKTCS